MTVKIKMKSIAAGPSGHFSLGETYDVEESVAERFIAGGYAERMEPPVVASSASSAPESVPQRGTPPEAAMLPPARPRVAASRGRK